MTGRGENKPPKPAVRPDRTAREAAALRANLLKRKDQARRREEAKAKPDSAG
jgi:hypothetical protein